MFVVEVVAALTTVIFLRDLATGGENLEFTFQIVVAVGHGAVREFRRGGGGGPRQGAGGFAPAHAYRDAGELLTGADRTKYKTVPGTTVLKIDHRAGEAGDIIPSDGEVIDGVASVNEGPLPASPRR